MTEPAPQRAPATPGESFAHEPKASTQRASHLGRGADPADDWQAEADDDIPDPVSQLREGAADPAGDEPVLDASAAKAVRAETETLRRGAERDPGDTT